MTTYVFPGQGSQWIGMGAGLFEQFPRLVELADAQLGYSIKTLCLEDPQHQLGQTAYTQPALYIVNCLDYLRLLHQRRRRPDYVAGHSLGEYAALFAAGAFDFVTGLQLVQLRGTLMARAAPGAMAAVIGLDATQVARILASKLADTALVIANDNSDRQVIIAGPHDAVLAAQPVFEQRGAARYMPLPVSGAFHSPLMAEAQQSFAQAIASVSFADPIIPVISNVDARPFRPGTIHERLTQQITHPVRWREIILYLLEQGETTFEELSGATTLTRLIAQIQGSSSRAEGAPTSR